MMSNYHHLSPEGNDKTNYAPPTEIRFLRLALAPGSITCFISMLFVSGHLSTLRFVVGEKDQR